jgi:hypothetical protein
MGGHLLVATACNRRPLVASRDGCRDQTLVTATIVTTAARSATAVADVLVRVKNGRKLSCRALPRRLLPVPAGPAAELIRLYHHRWEIGLMPFTIVTTAQRPRIRCHTVGGMRVHLSWRVGCRLAGRGFQVPPPRAVSNVRDTLMPCGLFSSSSVAWSSPP